MQCKDSKQVCGQFDDASRPRKLHIHEEGQCLKEHHSKLGIHQTIVWLPFLEEMKHLIVALEDASFAFIAFAGRRHPAKLSRFNDSFAYPVGLDELVSSNNRSSTRDICTIVHTSRPDKDLRLHTLLKYRYRSHFPIPTHGSTSSR